MSTRERIDSIINEFDEEQLDNLVELLINLKKKFDYEKEDDMFCQNLLEEYLNDTSPDKHESVTIEEYANKLGIDLNEI